MNTLLDMECAKKGCEISDKSDEAILRKSLGVLQEDGVYSLFLYLKYNKKGDIIDKLYKFLKQDNILKDKFGGETDALKAIRDKLADNLDQLLFIKELLERTITYALYHSRSKHQNESKNETSEETPKASITDEQGN